MGRVHSKELLKLLMRSWKWKNKIKRKKYLVALVLVAKYVSPSPEDDLFYLQKLRILQT